MWWLQAWHSFIPFHASWLPASHGGYGDIVSEKRLLGLEGAFPVARPQRNKTWPLSILVLCISVSKRIFTGPWYSKRSFHSAFMVQWSSTCWDKSQGCEWWVPSRVVRGLFLRLPQSEGSLRAGSPNLRGPFTQVLSQQNWSEPTLFRWSNTI